MSSHIPIPVEKVIAFCQRHPIRKLALFGSVLRDDFTPESDVDVLVEFLPNARISLLDMVSLEMELTAMFGRQVDLRTPQELSRYFRDKVIASSEVLYERN